MCKRSPQTTRRSRHTLRARHNLATPRRNVDSSDGLVVSFQLVFQLELGRRCALVELDGGIAHDCEEFAIGGKGVVGDWCMEEVMDFWMNHCIRDGVGVVNRTAPMRR